VVISVTLLSRETKTAYGNGFSGIDEPSLNTTFAFVQLPDLSIANTVSPTFISPIAFHLSLSISTSVEDAKQLHLHQQ
jgi:hypothetical protein